MGLNHLQSDHPCESYGEKYCPKCRLRYWCFTLLDHPLPGTIRPPPKPPQNPENSGPA